MQLLRAFYPQTIPESNSKFLASPGLGPEKRRTDRHRVADSQQRDYPGLRTRIWPVFDTLQPRKQI